MAANKLVSWCYPFKFKTFSHSCSAKQIKHDEPLMFESTSDFYERLPTLNCSGVSFEMGIYNHPTEDCKLFIDGLIQNPNIKSINVVFYQNINILYLLMLDQLFRSDKFEEIRVSNRCDVLFESSSVYVEKIINALSDNHGPRRLYLDKLLSLQRDTNELFGSLINNTKIETFVPPKTGYITSENVSLLLTVNKTLRDVTFHETNIRFDVCYSFAVKSPVMRKIKIGGGMDANETSRNFFSSMIENLEELVIEQGVDLYGEAARYFLDFLKNTTKLKVLKFGRLYLCPTFYQEFFDLLISNKTISNFRIDYFKTDPQITENLDSPILRLFTENMTIQKISLANSLLNYGKQTPSKVLKIVKNLLKEKKITKCSDAFYDSVTKAYLLNAKFFILSNMSQIPFEPPSLITIESEIEKEKPKRGRPKRSLIESRRLQSSSREESNISKRTRSQ